MTKEIRRQVFEDIKEDLHDIALRCTCGEAIPIMRVIDEIRQNVDVVLTMLDDYEDCLQLDLPLNNPNNEGN